MAVAAVKQIEQFESAEYFERLHLRLVEATPEFEQLNLRLVEAAPEMAEDQLIKLRAARFIGAIALNDQFNLSKPERNAGQPIESLHDAIQRAAEGDKEARSMVSINVRTDVTERTIKSGHITKVAWNVDEPGELWQYGQSVESIQANSLRYAADSWQIRERTEAETTNAFRIKEHQRSGKLKDHSFVVISRAADNMTKDEMVDANFFTDTMSFAIQATTEADGILTTESAFVAGVKELGADRHDAETVVALAAKLGIDFRSMSAAEIINTPLLIHNRLMPNGVIDLVELADDSAGGTFFGEDRPREDYAKYKEKCEERERMLQPKVDAIVNELISEAPSIKTPLDAVIRLGKLSEKHMVEQAAFDVGINPRVFGPVAAGYIEQARHQFAHGDLSGGLDSIQSAKSTASSGACPSSLKKSLSDASLNNLSDDTTDNGPEEDTGECDFISKECPKCGTKNVKTHVTKTHIKGSCGCEVKKK